MQFVLLHDFQRAYDVFPLKKIDTAGVLDQAVVNPMREALAEAVTDFRQLTSDDIDQLTGNVAREDKFLVTLDGGTYFRTPDFSFEMTRAASSVDDIANGPHARVRRSGRNDLMAQVIRLRKLYVESGNGRPLLLCDDGIGTGKSLENIIHIFHQYDPGLAIEQICVIANPSGVSAIRGVPVHSLIELQPGTEWLSERDLYWGLPRSGMSYTSVSDMDPKYGVPYTIDVEMVTSRIGLDRGVAADFRDHALKLNVVFWQFLERQHARHLYFEDCSRLAFFPDLFGISNRRVVEALSDFNAPDFRLKSLEPVRA